MTDTDPENSVANWIMATAVIVGGLLAVVITGSIIQPPVSLIQFGGAVLILMVLAPVLMGAFAFVVAITIRGAREARQRWSA